MNTQILYDPDADKFERLIVCDYIEEQGNPSANPWRWIINNDKKPKNHKGWVDEAYLAHAKTHIYPIECCIPSNIWTICYTLYTENKYRDNPYDRLVQALIQLEAKNQAPWNTQTGAVEV